MEDDVDAIEPRTDALDIGNVSAHYGKRWMPPNANEIGLSAAAVVVDAGHLETVGQQALYQMAADETGAAGHHSAFVLVPKRDAFHRFLPTLSSNVTSKADKGVRDDDAASSDVTSP
jgi:hypothetical protein